MMVATDVGVTEEPCPGGNPDRGCIYLGVLTDESGPFQAASAPLYGAQQLFWATVNAGDGIGGAYDVAVPEDLKKDTQYQPDVLVASYNQIAGDVAALAMSLGTSQSIAAIPDYERDSTIAVPMSWWSGWAFEDSIIEFGTNYCFEAMNAIDWAAGAFPAQDRELCTRSESSPFPTTTAWTMRQVLLWLPRPTASRSSGTSRSSRRRPVVIRPRPRQLPRSSVKLRTW